jgi:Type I phosphodiesterase / nucleotide pyrophosphatase
MCALPSSTYPSFASLLTGKMPHEHGVRTTNWIAGGVPGWAGTRSACSPTLFDACRTAGLRSAAVLGDHCLHEVLRAESATVRWPAENVVEPDVELNAQGYAVNAAVLPHLIEQVADASVDFVFGRLNEADTIGHEYRPDHELVQRCYSDTDAAVGQVLEALHDDWQRTVLIVVSDHGMESWTGTPPIDVERACADWVEAAVPDGGGALVRLRHGASADAATDAIRRLPGVEVVDREPELLVVGAAPGYRFASGGSLDRGFHGGPATASTLAILAGGHPAVEQLAARIEQHRPHLRDWAPVIASVLCHGVSIGVG